jgi:uncharacterized membrane protein
MQMLSVGDAGGKDIAEGTVSVTEGWWSIQSETSNACIDIDGIK